MHKRADLTLREEFYHPELDGLRFFAFLLVFIHHAPVLLDNPLFITLHDYGWIGVDLFLCLSAFLFARLLFMENQSKGDINIRDFYIRRMLRIWPLYFVFLGISFALSVANLGWSTDLTWRILGMALFADNIFSAIWGYNRLFGSAHLWTIAYEEQFYAVIPWLLRRIFTVEYKKKLSALLLIFLTFSLAKAVMIYFKIPHPAIWVLPITHFESILGGLVVGLGLFDHYLKRVPGWLCMTAGLVSTAIVCTQPNGDVIGWRLMFTYPLLGLGMALILFSVVRDGQWFAKSLLQHTRLAYLGKISYGLYVFHLLAIKYGKQITFALGILPRRQVLYPWSVFWVGLCITLLVSMASYQWLEKPFLRLKKRFTSIQSRPV
jgi:peptidoglycan/LPS O-acetylase OafA/YrhL